MRNRLTQVFALALACSVSVVALAETSARTPLDLSLSSREALARSLTDILHKSPLDTSRVGVQVVSLDTGEVVFAHNANELLNPASNMKLVTTAAALAILGPEYKFTTEFACSQRLVNGECPILYIRGKGDPQLYTERLYGIAGELLHRGLRRVGRIVVDDTYFDDVRGGPGWDQENTANSDRAYLAPAGALSINHNTIAIYVTPGQAAGQRAHIELEPSSDYFVVNNSVTTVAPRARGRLTPSSQPYGDRQRVSVDGRLPAGRPASVFYRKIDNPPLYAGETFKAVFNARGISVRGTVRQGVMPEGAIELYASSSRSLAEIVREVNKVSNNFMAEQLLKTIGAEVKGPPGTWSKGVEATEEWLSGIGIPKGSFVMQNGSGLNDTNRFSVSQMTRLLAAVENRSWFYPEFAASLPIAGRDGTLRNRMDDTQAAGRLRGKTGTLENVTSLSGYMRLTSGERLAYSILVNDFTTRHWPAIQAVNAIGATIAAGGRAIEEPPARLASDTPPPSSGELKARAATFARLGQAADSRNLPFLRRAMRTETDPILRAVIADAVYRADADVGVAWLLENVPTSADAFAKLRSVGQELSVPTPAVSSLIDVAAEGNPDALDKLLALIHATSLTGPDTLFTEGLQEVGRNAPEELYEAIGRASDDVSIAAVDVLSRGILESGDAQEHPFVTRLRAPGDDGEPVATALAFYERIEEALAKLTDERRRAQQAASDARTQPQPTEPSRHGPPTVELPGGG